MCKGNINVAKYFNSTVRVIISGRRRNEERERKEGEERKNKEEGKDRRDLK